jgi:hypothetical protein
VSRTKLFILPGIAALVVIGALALSACTALGAQLTGPGSDWARTVRMHAPGPAGPPITVTFDPCPGLVAGGCWTPWDSTIYVASDFEQPFIYAHELGHAFDTRNLSDGERAWFLSVFGYDDGQAWAPERAPDDPFCERQSCPSERFADAYAICALGLRPSAYLKDGSVLFLGVHDYGYYHGAVGIAGVARARDRVCRAVTAFSSPT